MLYTDLFYWQVSGSKRGQLNGCPDLSFQWTSSLHLNCRISPLVTNTPLPPSKSVQALNFDPSAAIAHWLEFLFLLLLLLSVGWDSPLGTAATTCLLYQPRMIDDGDCGTIGGMKIGRGNRSTWRKPVPEPHCPPQIPHEQTRARTRAVAVGSQRLTAWAMARSKLITVTGY
jgi:hypothetical protein